MLNVKKHVAEIPPERADISQYSSDAGGLLLKMMKTWFIQNRLGRKKTMARPPECLMRSCHRRGEASSTPHQMPQLSRLPRARWGLDLGIGLGQRLVGTCVGPPTGSQGEEAMFMGQF